MSVPQKSHKNGKEQCHMITLAIVGLLCKVGWALDNDSTDFCYHPFHCNSQSKVLERVKNNLLVIECSQSYTSFVVLVLFHKMREWGANFRGGAYFKFWPIGGALF